jgi:hypothetical protein
MHGECVGSHALFSPPLASPPLPSPECYHKPAELLAISVETIFEEACLAIDLRGKFEPAFGTPDIVNFGKTAYNCDFLSGYKERYSVVGTDVSILKNDFLKDEGGQSQGKDCQVCKQIVAVMPVYISTQVQKFRHILHVL